MSTSTTKTREWDFTGQVIVKKINKVLGSTAWQGEAITSFNSTTIPTAVSESSLTPGALYKIFDIYSVGDFLYVRALDASTFESNGIYYNYLIGVDVYCNVACTVNQVGVSIRSTDPTISANVTNSYNAGLELLMVDSSTGAGELRITIDNTVTLSAILGGFEGQEITIFVEGGLGNGLDIASTGNILSNALYSPCFVIDDYTSFATLRKRGSSWIIINAFV